MNTQAPKRYSRRAFLRATRNVLAGTALASVSSYAYGTQLELNWLKVTRVTVPIHNLPAAAEGFRIAQLTDLHLRPVTTLENIRAAVALANSLKPDLTVLTGDYVTDRAEDIDELAPVLGQLNARHGVFAALGNHDLWTNAEVVRGSLERAGVPVLVNSGFALPVGVYVAGVDDAWSGQPDLYAALAGNTAHQPTVLLAHEPDFVDDFSQDTRVALQLSGHTHGGQIRLPGWGALALPAYGQKYDYGLFRVRQSWLYTSSGIGSAFFGVRLNCRPEVAELTLVKA